MIVYIEQYESQDYDECNENLGVYVSLDHDSFDNIWEEYLGEMKRAKEIHKQLKRKQKFKFSYTEWLCKNKGFKKLENNQWQ